MAALGLVGCSASWSFGPGRFDGPAPAPSAPARVIVEPTGQVITTPLDPIEQTIEGLSQAQTVRTLVRQLSR
jgi:hypothetical protein